MAGQADGEVITKTLYVNKVYVIKYMYLLILLTNGKREWINATYTITQSDES